jgi:hypothetical protein
VTATAAETRLHLEQRQRLARIRLPPFGDDPGATRSIRAAYAASELRPRLPDSDNPCAFTPAALAFLSELLERLGPSSVVEFGSGRTTELLAQWASRHRATVVSVEHDARWVRRVEQTLSPEVRGSVSLVHHSLALRWAVGKMALTYRNLQDLRRPVEASGLVLLDGPHASGREAVLWFVLQHAATGATILIDDYNHYCVREMLAAVPPEISIRFAGVALEENSHGLYVLQCLRSATRDVRAPVAPMRAVLRSCWRCYLDHRAYGRDA